MYNVGDRVMLAGPRTAWGRGGVGRGDVGVSVGGDRYPRRGEYDTTHYIKGDRLTTHDRVLWLGGVGGEWCGGFHDLVLAAPAVETMDSVPCPPSLQPRRRKTGEGIPDDLFEAALLRPDAIPF